MKIIKFEEWILRHTNESLKNDKLNAILDKMSSGSELSKSEQSFLDNFSDISTVDMQDYTLLNKSGVYDKIMFLIDKNKTVTFSNEVIIDIKYHQDDIIIATRMDSTKLKDNCLYNLIYDFDKDIHTLEIHDEYYEKLPLKND